MKSHILYHPIPANVNKYERFYGKLYQMAESKNFVEKTTVRTIDGIMLDGIYIKNPDTDKCIIFFHGNAGNISMRFDMVKFLYNYASVLIFDYRSFGKSSGEISNLSSNGLIKDAEAIWKYTVEKIGVKANNISFFGESLGCSIAIYLTAKLSSDFDSNNYPHSLILNSPFFSLKSMIDITFNKLNIGFVGKIITLLFGREFMSNEWIQLINYRTKIIIAHSPRDEVIPYMEGLKLYNLISETHTNTKFINITGTHNNLGLTDNYIYTLADIFND
jgi:hypothetical protein